MEMRSWCLRENISTWIVYRYMPETVVSEKALFKNKS